MRISTGQVKRSLRRGSVQVRGRLGLGTSTYLRESTAYADLGEPGPLITDVFRRIKDIPGWFNVDDCGHFYLLLTYQSLLGLSGDVFEIGSYHGRSTALMASRLQPGERIVVCDAFERDTEDSYESDPSPETLIANIHRLAPDLGRDRIVIHACLSSELDLEPREMFRFVHIDGGHSAEQVYADLRLCHTRLVPNGIMVVDDYRNRLYPGVAEGTDRFLRETDDVRVVADLNRHGALGRKLYLTRTGS